MRCPNCGTENRPGAQFCRHCAAPLIRLAAPGSAAPGQASPAVSLVAQRGPQAGQTFALHDGVNTIGRAPGNDVLLSESSVSRHHARIMVRPEGVWIEDLGSTSGTFVNGQRVTGSTWLRSGDAVQVGGSVILGVQVASAMAPAFPTAPPSVAAPTAAVPLAAAQPQAMQVCPSCGAQNRPGVRFCEQCAAPLVAGVPPAPARRPKRRRRALLVGSLIGVSALVVLALVGMLYVRPLLGGGLQLPSVGDWSTMTEDEATAIGTSIIEQEYPELASVTPTVTEGQVQGHRIYDVSFSTMVPVEGGEFRWAVIVAIDTDSEEISVFESD